MKPREELFFLILIFFALITGAIAVINISSAMDKEHSLTSSVLADLVVGNGANNGISGQMAISQSVRPYIEGANTAPGIAIAGIDFTSATAIDTNITTLEGGTWTLTPGTGLILTSGPLIPIFGSDSTVFLRNVKSVGNVYTVSVKVDNSQAGGPWFIIPRNYVALKTVYDLNVVFDSTGIHIKKNTNPFDILFGGNQDDYFYPMPGASNTIAGGSTITTVLTEIPGTESLVVGQVGEQSTLKVSKDGVLLFTTAVGNGRAGSVNNDDVRHGGVGTWSKNFIIKGFPGTSMVSTPESIISNGGGTAPSDPLTAIFSFWDLISVAMGLGNQAIIPIWLSAIVILPCLAALILIGLEILRGV